MSAQDTTKTTEQDQSAAAQGVPAAGSLAYLYGHEPVVIFGELEKDGTVEVARFASFEYLPATDLNVGARAAKPEVLLPVPPTPADKVAALEATVAAQSEQLAKLIALLEQRGALDAGAADTSKVQAQVAEVAPAAPATAAAPAGDIVQPFGTPREPAAPAAPEGEV